MNDSEPLEGGNGSHAVSLRANTGLKPPTYGERKLLTIPRVSPMLSEILEIAWQRRLDLMLRIVRRLM